MGFALRSLNLAKKYDLKEERSAANPELSEIYEKMGDDRNSLKYYKDYITYRDSVSNIKSVEQMADLRTNFEVSKKQVEVDLLNQQKRNQHIVLISLFIILGLTVVILATLFWY
jgi:adenylate cyclase